MRSTLKALAHALATMVVSPAIASFHLRSGLLGRNRSLQGSTEAFALLPGLVGVYLRRAFLSHAIAHCDRTASVHFGTIFSQVGARLDANVYVGPRCHLGLVHVERDALLAAGVHVPSGGDTHGTSDLSRPIREQEGRRTLVTIGEGSWIGSGAIVLADVGRHSIVGAGSVVTKALPDYVVAAGVPARVLKSREPVPTTQA